MDLQLAQDILMKKRQNNPTTPRPLGHIADIVIQKTAVIDSPITSDDIDIPDRVTLSSLQITHPLLESAVEMCHNWKKQKENGASFSSMVLVGPYGTGKTHIAKSILWSICYTLDDGIPVSFAGKFFSATDLMMKFNPIKTEWGGQEIPQPSDFIKQSPIIVIDDVGTEQRLPFIAAQDQEQEIEARYYRVIDYCYDKGISIVITGNITLDELPRIVGGRSWDRLCQMAPKGFMIDLTGVPSWRQKESGR